MPRCWILAASLLVAAAHAQDASVPLKFSGYAKNLLIDSTTLVGSSEHYTLDLTRVRLELKGPIARQLAVDLQYDNELQLGDYLGTRQFALARDLAPPTYWRAQSTYVDRPSLFGQHRLYRASLTASAGNTDARLGRQRIAWGTGRFWSPLDILNPPSPVAIEREERIGVDALLVEHKLDALSRAAWVYAPQHGSGNDSVAAMWHDHVADIDYSVVAGRFRRDRVIGLDAAGQVGLAGVRAEATHTDREGAGSFNRVLLGVDYAFANTLTVSAEAFYDGAGAADRSRYDVAALLSGQVLNLARRYIGVSAGYEITPLLKTRHDVVVNLDDHSRYYSPTLSYSLRANLDATLGIQWFHGSPGSEFAIFKRVVYGQLQWFF